MPELLSYLPIIVICGASIVLFLNIGWRWNILALSIQYVGVFWLVLTLWPTGLAAVKLVSGWMAGAMLGSSISEDHVHKNVTTYSTTEEIKFRFVLWFIVLLVVLTFIPKISNWLPISPNLLMGSLILIFVGLLQLSMTNVPHGIIFGLLTVLSGFEIIYAGLENSVLVAGFLSIITIGISFIGVFISQAKNEVGIS